MESRRWDFMNESYKNLIAKCDSSEGKWLPLWVHCLDTCQVMRYLLSHWLTDHTLNAAASSISQEQLKNTLLFLSVFHDYGKASMTFQARITDEAEELRQLLNHAGLCTPSADDPELRNGKEMPHGTAGEILLLIKGCPSSIAAIVGAHHGKPWEKGPDAAEDIEELLEENDLYRNFDYGLRLWGGKARRKEWIRAQNDFFDWALDEINLSSVQEVPSVNDSEAVVLSGLVIMADWLASNEEYFPLIPFGQNAPSNMKERAEYAEKKLNLPPVWQPSFNENFRELAKKRFGFYPNEIQTAVAEAVIKSSEPGLFILEAPMGVGKTEAALLAAEEFSGERAAGMMFALPTQATANGIFSRILEWGKGQTEQNELSIRLAHGMAAMNEEYMALIDSGKHAECTVDDYENSRFVVHDFFRGSKQALLADFVVGTIDQVLLASLKQKHFMLRHLGLCGKAVIIDECHAYDAYMNEYLERTLQWLGAYRTPVIMLSATLPYERRAALVDAYTGYTSKNKDEPWRKSTGYPLLTWTDGSNICQEEIVYSGIKRNVEIERLDCAEKDEFTEVIRILAENLESGGCAGVVLNTVKRTQALTEALNKAMPDKHILLLHSGFISEDRIEYEKELLACAGKKSAKTDRDGFIVIGTQVIEQSLDFDVDLMITDLCPMDLLLQRIGRLHRHPAHDKDRPAALKTAKCYVLGAAGKYEKGSEAVYGSYLLMRTKEFLPDRITLPTDIAVLVQSVYDDSCIMKKEPDGYSEAKAKHEQKRIKDRRDADAFRLLPPGKEKTINRFLEASVLADEEQAKAQVRNGEISLEAIVMFSEKGSLTRAPWRYSDCFNPSDCPSESACRAISNQRVRFPAWIKGMISSEDLLMPEAWENSSWLRGKRLLILNEEGKTEIGNLIIQYSHTYGLTAERRTQT